MSSPSDFTVMTWSLDHGWVYKGAWQSVDVTYPPTLAGNAAALDAMRRDYTAAQRPPLAEAIAEAAIVEWIGPGAAKLLDMESAAAKETIAAVQRVLDERGVGDE